MLGVLKLKMLRIGDGASAQSGATFADSADSADPWRILGSSSMEDYLELSPANRSFVVK